MEERLHLGESYGDSTAPTRDQTTLAVSRVWREYEAVKTCIFSFFVVAGTSCVPPTLHFYQPPPEHYTTIAALTDTVFLRRFQPADSIPPDGVQLTYDLLDRAQETQRDSAIQTLESVLATIPANDRQRGPKPRSQEGSILGRLSAQKKAYQYDLARADAVFVESVQPDTVFREIIVEPEDEFEEPQIVTETWLALILNVRAVFDPEFGRRAAVR